MSSLIDEGPNCAELCRKTCRSFGAWLSPSCLSLLCMRSKAAASSCNHSLLVGQVVQDRLLDPQIRNKVYDLRTRGRYSAGDLCKHAPRSGSNNLTSCRSTLSLDWSLISASLQGSGQKLQPLPASSLKCHGALSLGTPVLVHFARLLPLCFCLKRSQKLVKLCLSSVFL